MGEFIQFLGQLVFFLANKPSSLRAIGEKINLAVTVEAEYGDECVEGSIITLAHH